MIKEPEVKASLANTGDIAVGPDQRSRGRRRLLWLLLGGLSVLLLVNLFIAGYYLLGKRPLRELPGVNALTMTAPPQYLFSVYDVSRPLGVAVSPDGQRIYATESGGERLVRIFDNDGRAIGSLRAPGATPGVRQPVYVATDAVGRVFVSDRAAPAVQIYSPDGEYLEDLAPPPGEQKWFPLALAFDRRGYLYVGETGERHRVVVYDEQLRFVRQFGDKGDAPGQFSYPNGLAVDQQGRIFVSDSNNGRLQVFDAEGKLLSEYGKQGAIGGQGLPRGIALDAQNRLHVVDAVNDSVKVFKVDAGRVQQLFTFGSQGNGDGQFRFPNGLALDPGGRVYITDSSNNRVQVFAY